MKPIFFESIQQSNNSQILATLYTMKQYVITAFDFTDAGALQRRMEARPHHFEKAKKLKATGNFIKGGAILNHEGKMIGSVMMMQFESDDALENWKINEPYIIGKVWEKIDIRPFMVADV